MPTEEQIRQLAYALWEQEGRPDGKDVEHFFRAQQILQQQELSVTELAAPPQPKEISAPKPPPQLSGRKLQGPPSRRRK